MFHIVGLGEILWDRLPCGKKLGGAPANFAFHAKGLGVDNVTAYIVSCIGDDADGREIQAHLAEKNINQEHLAVSKSHETGKVMVLVNDNGEPDYDIVQNVAWDFIPEGSPELASKADAVCFGSLAQRNPVSANNMMAFLDALPDKTLRLFDINLRQSFYDSGIISASLERADVLKINHQELQAVAGLLNLEGDDATLLHRIGEDYGLELCVLTRGDHGSVLYSETSTSVHDGFEINVKDSVGAGDAFTAAIAIGLLQGFELDYLNECANRLAAFVCTESGATPELPESITRLFAI